MPGDETIIRDLEAIMAQTGLSYSALAALVGVAPGTMRFLLLTRELPNRSQARMRIAGFANRNRGAQSRADVRLA